MFRITHGERYETIVPDAKGVGDIVMNMVERGLTNILITRAASDVRVRQDDLRGPKLPGGPICNLYFSVIVCDG
jgi:hypothetical protein